DGRGGAGEERGARPPVVEERGGPRTHAEAGAGPLQDAPREEGGDVRSRREEDAGRRDEEDGRDEDDPSAEPVGESAEQWQDDDECQLVRREHGRDEEGGDRKS